MGVCVVHQTRSGYCVVRSIAVSYTHLDVYKRQVAVCGCACRRALVDAQGSLAFRSVQVANCAPLEIRSGISVPVTVSGQQCEILLAGVLHRVNRQTSCNPSCGKLLASVNPSNGGQRDVYKRQLSILSECSSLLCSKLPRRCLLQYPQRRNI